MVNRVFFALVGLIFIIFVYEKVKKKVLSEKESIFWMIGSIIILILGIIPEITSILAQKLNIEYPPALLFFVGIVFTLGLVFRLTVQTSALKEQTKELAQVIALLQKRITDLENSK